MLNQNRSKNIIRVTVTGAIANFVLLVLKFVIGFIGGSGALLADAIHSLSDFITDGIVLIFLHISAKPKDVGHDYGHGKFETLATAFIGLLLLLVGVGLFVSNAHCLYQWFIEGKILSSPESITIWVAIFSILVKELLYQWTFRVGTLENSQAVIANAWHHRSDALSSVATTIGIGGAVWLGPTWAVLDPLAAVLVSLFIVKAAWKLSIPALNDLLEQSLPAELENEILSLIESTPEVQESHNLHTRRIGNDIAIEASICVSGSMSVTHAHNITKTIEGRLLKRFGLATHIILHVEPKS
ncbi:MAG: cation diffusion facilitator family transporter [Massilibacteroides sp.]|nr:cation diffusion facilitator family transporter [Massilibacteroides sp.]